VTNTYDRFMGFKALKMDPKYRVSIQPLWRPEVGIPLYLMLSEKHDMPFVRVLSKEAYDEKVQLIQNSNMTPAEKSDFLGRLALFSRDAAINEQGKLAVPKDFCESAGIAAESDVMLAGRGILFEIWSKSNFDKMVSIEKQLQKKADDLGIF
jgi:DNA-binding transcriptional regulator/RsmH inhibitor MraZ